MARTKSLHLRFIINYQRVIINTCLVIEKKKLIKVAYCSILFFRHCEKCRQNIRFIFYFILRITKCKDDLLTIVPTEINEEYSGFARQANVTRTRDNVAPEINRVEQYM